MAPHVEIFGSADGDSSTWGSFLGSPDTRVLVAVDILDTLLNRLSYFYDEDFLAMLEEGGAKAPPFHNGGESLTYTNVLFEYEEKQARDQGTADWKDEFGRHIQHLGEMVDEEMECSRKPSIMPRMGFSMTS